MRNQTGKSGGDVVLVLLVDDEEHQRELTELSLVGADPTLVITAAQTPSQALSLLLEQPFDCLVSDYQMPGMNGVIATSKVKKILPQTRIIILTVYEDETHVFNAIKAGAMGYLLKDVSIDELVEAIHSVYKGEALIQPRIAAKVLKEFTMLDKRTMKEGDKFYNDLTEREKEVLRLIALGGTNKEIAQKLGITEKSVKNHISHIFQTLQVNNRTQAAIYALDRKL